MPISRAQTGKQVKNAPSSKKANKVMGEFKKAAGGKLPKPKCRNGIAIRGRTIGRTV
jgi:hypothetical protein